MNMAEAAWCTASCELQLLGDCDLQGSHASRSVGVAVCVILAGSYNRSSSALNSAFTLGLWKSSTLPWGQSWCRTVARFSSKSLRGNSVTCPVMGQDMLGEAVRAVSSMACPCGPWPGA